MKMSISLKIPKVTTAVDPPRTPMDMPSDFPGDGDSTGRLKLFSDVRVRSFRGRFFFLFLLIFCFRNRAERQLLGNLPADLATMTPRTL